MKTVKKVLALILTLVLLIGTIADTNVTALAANETSASLTYANGWDWSDDYCYQNQIFVYASASETATPASIHGMGTGFLGWQNGIVFEYNDANDTWTVVTCDFTADGTNAAESATLGSNRFAVIFHNEASVGQTASYNYLVNNAKVGAEFTLTGDISTLQSASGSISGVSISLATVKEDTTTSTPVVSGITSGSLTYANGYDWSDSYCYQNQIFVYASSSSTATAASIHGNGTGFLGWQNGFVLEYNSTNGTWEVVLSDFVADGTNEAESATLGSNRMAVIFHNEASVGQADSYEFFTTYAKVGAEFYLTGDISTLQSASGSISGVSLSINASEDTTTPEEDTTTPSEPEEDTTVPEEDTTTPEEDTTTPSEPEEDTTTPEVTTTASGSLTYANGWDWSDDYCYQNQIFVYASSSSTATAASIHGNGTGFLGWQNGFVLEYNSTSGTWEVVISDFVADGTNAAESATLGSNRIAVIFHNQASVGQADSYEFFTTYAKVGAEFTLTGSLSTLQSASGSISGVSLSLATANEDTTTPEEDTTTPEEDTTVPEEDTTTPSEPEEDTTTPEVTTTASGSLTYANGWDWSDDYCYQNQIFVYASSSSTATPASIHGNGTGFLGWQNGIVLEYNSTSGTWEVVISDFVADGTNAAESATLGSNRMAVIFHNQASVGQADSYEFFTTYATLGAEFTLTGDISTLQSASGSISGVSLSYVVPEDDSTTEEDTTTPDDTTTPEDDTTTVTPDGTTVGYITSVNYYQWVDSAPQANHIYAYATTDSSQTPKSTFHAGYNLFASGNGIVFQYNSTTGKYKAITVDFDTTDGVNAAESQGLSDGILVVLFGEDAATGQSEAYNFFKDNVKVGGEYYLSTELSYIQYSEGATGSVNNLYVSTAPIVKTESSTTTPTLSDTSVGTISSTVGTYTSTGSSTASSGDTDGLSCVLYAPQNNTVGISTYVNLSAINTNLYTNDEALAKQSLGIGTPNNTDIDNAYMYLCLNSTNWSGDFGLIKRLGDADWEICTSEYYYNNWRWNAYAYASESGVDVYYNPEYVYSMFNVMDGREAYYIKDCYAIKDLQMSLIYSDGTLTYKLTAGGVTIFSVSDTGTVSSAKFGRAASITNSSTTTYDNANYLYQISSTLNGRTPAELSNVQFYDTYYYTSSGYGRLTVDAGSLWIYPSSTSSAGYQVDANGDPLVSCQEVILSDGRYMDIIDIQNY